MFYFTNFTLHSERFKFHLSRDTSDDILVFLFPIPVMPQTHLGWIIVIAWVMRSSLYCIRMLIADVYTGSRKFIAV